MNAELFKKQLLENDKTDYGLCPPPLDAQKGLDILIDHFLGKDWYVAMPVSTEQTNSEAVYEILLRHGEKGKFFQQTDNTAMLQLLCDVKGLLLNNDTPSHEQRAEVIGAINVVLAQQQQ